MPDRLAELVRQRALVHEHLTWLDQQIAQAGLRHTDEPGTGESIPPVSLPAPTGATATLPNEAETILAQHRLGADTVRRNVRHGCIIYFAVGLIALALLVTVLFFTVSSR